MKTHSIILCLLLMTIAGHAQYEATLQNPYGLPNPDAPEQIKDYQGLIGECSCISVRRNPDQSWGEEVPMKWTFKYIMNGMAVQDETIKADGKHSGSIRQFHKDSLRWYVHYYSSGAPSTILPVWEGTKKDNEITLYREQKAPNGAEGYFRLRFHDIDKKGYKWVGAWTSKDEKTVFPTWKIICTRNED